MWTPGISFYSASLQLQLWVVCAGAWVGSWIWELEASLLGRLKGHLSLCLALSLSVHPWLASLPATLAS